MKLLQILLSIIGIITGTAPIKNLDTIPIYLKDTIITAEVAHSATEISKGLMFRKHLDKSSGMLFIFPFESKHTFWMKNTKIPLDIIWIDKNKKIVHIAKNAQPCTTLPCPTYKSPQPAKYVLEVNGGWCEKHNIAVEDTLEFEL